MHLAAELANLGLIGFKVQIDMRERMIFDVARAVAERFEFGQPLRRLGAPLDEIGADMGKRFLQRRVAQGFVRIVLEMGRGRMRGHFGASVFAAPIAGSSIMPARTSAIWRAATGLPSRVSLPAIFIKQPRSPASNVVAPLAAIFAVFCVTIASESSPYLTANVPPKPQQTSGDFISLSSSPSTVLKSFRGWRCTPSSRRPEQES